MTLLVAQPMNSGVLISQFLPGALVRKRGVNTNHCAWIDLALRRSCERINASRVALRGVKGQLRWHVFARLDPRIANTVIDTQNGAAFLHGRPTPAVMLFSRSESAITIPSEAPPGE